MLNCRSEPTRHSDSLELNSNEMFEHRAAFELFQFHTIETHYCTFM